MLWTHLIIESKKFPPNYLNEIMKIKDIPIPWLVMATVAAMAMFALLGDQLGFWLAAATFVLGCMEFLPKDE